MNTNIDEIALNFSQGSLLVLNIILGFIMFGVALELKTENFLYLLKNPKSAIVGIFSQFFLLPLFTFIIIMLIRPNASLALGMILVASCPGGNISNFLSALSKSNTELSISLTAFSTLFAIFITPFNFSFWSSLYFGQFGESTDLYLNPLDMFFNILVLLAIPTVLGMIFSKIFPRITLKIFKPIRFLSILIFLGFVIMAFMNNYENFTNYIQLVFILVLIHNASALLIGYFTARVFRLSKKDCRTISIETGIQNSGLGLILIFTFFNGNGGMAMVAAWWGIWHILSGLFIAMFWSRKTAELLV